MAGKETAVTSYKILEKQYETNTFPVARALI